jgi:hypothetical protein
MKTTIIGVTLACSLVIGGCLSAITLDRAILAYDDAVTDAVAKQLLMNIARAQHHEPIHFTWVLDIAGTFDSRFNAGAIPRLRGGSGKRLVPVFGGSVGETPTISIVPLPGEEFAKRLLTPLDRGTFILFLRQQFNIGLLLRLMAEELRIREREEDIAFRNMPGDRLGYEKFRRAVLHLSAIQDKNQLYAEPLIFNRAWTIPGNSVTAENFRAFENEYVVTYNHGDNTYTLQKQVSGHIRITNYNPAILSQEERARLNEETEEQHINDVSFDIRPGHFGGEYPMKGHFRLRSFNAMLHFLAQSLGDEREYHVDKDPLTPEVTENPVYTMEIVRSDQKPSSADFAIRSHGSYYAIKTDGDHTRWNRDAFRVLYLLFQMIGTEPPRIGVTGIAIAD